MLFIILLILTTAAIATSAAFFSVYGLAATFSGVFWSVVLMGASLEAGKLIAASYLYRYWNTTNRWLKAYLMSGILALMVLTSTGIFSYLSVGYQQDVLPLKQIEQQVVVLEEEKARLLARKAQIDDQIANLPQNSVRGRTALIRGFKDEQTTVTTRIQELDQQILEKKTKVIETQAHIGPITYIASAFGLDTDNATKYLIYLIIFAFDPMAVALTLAVNIAIRLRKEDIAAAERQAHEERVRKMQLEHEERMLAERFTQEETSQVATTPAATVAGGIHEPWTEARSSLSGLEPEITEEELRQAFPEPFNAEPTPTEDDPSTTDPVPEPTVEELVDDSIQDGQGTEATEVAVQPEAPAEEPAQVADVELLERPGDHLLDTVSPIPVANAALTRRHRPYNQLPTSLSDGKLNELIQHYRWLKQKAETDGLTQDDRWEMEAVEDVLRRHGLGIYLS